MNRITVVVPSKTDSNLVACLEMVRAHEGRDVRVIVVDDGLQSADSLAMCDITLAGKQPFVFARNCNIAIRLAAPDDIVLLNDDAQLITPGGLQALQRAAAEHPDYGLIGAACNNVGNPRQRPQGHYQLHEEPSVVCFVCVFIPWRTFERVGLLDERFTTYGWEDNDFCRRVQLAGLKLGIHDGVYVDHGSLVSTFRGRPGAGGDIEPGRQIFLEKWGAGVL